MTQSGHIANLQGRALHALLAGLPLVLNFLGS